jgi:hypothetical protein
LDDGDDQFGSGVHPMWEIFPRHAPRVLDPQCLRSGLCRALSFTKELFTL